MNLTCLADDEMTFLINIYIIYIFNFDYFCTFILVWLF